MTDKSKNHVADDIIEMVKKDLGEIQSESFFEDLRIVTVINMRSIMYLHELNKKLHNEELMILVKKEHFYNFYMGEVRRLVNVIYIDLRNRGHQIDLLDGTVGEVT